MEKSAVKTALVTALVPLKGHSERVPNKNIRMFGGKPLCCHIIGSLSLARRIGEIIVDTDSPEIKRIVHDHFPDVKILDRPDGLRGTKVPATPLIEHDLKFASHEYFIQTHATTPLISAATIDRAIEAFFVGLDAGYDSLMGVNRYQTRFYRSDGTPINHDPEIMVPSQDMPVMYEDNSNFYVNTVENFYRRRNRVGRKVIFFEVPKIESLDIDEPEDFVIAEAVHAAMGRRK
jgi:CMP-N-acetylneuraminic acid synthetase